MDQYNRFEFALGLAGDPNVVRIRSLFREASRNTHFADYLVNTSILTTISVPLPGDLVLYRHSECFTHADVVRPESIISKWGVRGHVWIHSLWDVPAIYGNAMDFYRLSDSPDLSNSFVEFAREREGTETIDGVLESPIPAPRSHHPHQHLEVAQLATVARWHLTAQYPVGRYGMKSEREILNQSREEVDEARRLFSNRGQALQEQTAVGGSLCVLEVPFGGHELVKRGQEPIDVSFRDSRFQVTENLDPKRRRSAELRSKARRISPPASIPRTEALLLEWPASS